MSKARQGNLMDVAHAFGISAGWLDTGADSLTYARAVDHRRDLMTHTLAEWGASVEAMVNTALPAGQQMRIDWTSYLRPDVEELVATWLPVHAAGLMSDQEFRQRVGLETGRVEQ